MFNENSFTYALLLQKQKNAIETIDKMCLQGVICFHFCSKYHRNSCFLFNELRILNILFSHTNFKRVHIL